MTDLLLDRQNTLWAGSVDQGVHFFANGTLSPTHERVMFEGQKAAVSLEDAAGGLWVRTDEKSYHIPLPYMLKSSKENKTLPASGIYCSENFGDSIFLAIDPLGLYRMKGNVVDAVPAPIFETRNQKRITKILAHPDSNQLWITGIGEFAIRQSDGRWSLVELPEDTKSQAITEMCYIGNDRMLIITPRKFFIYRGEELLQVSNEFSERLMGVCKGPGDSFFIASHGGVYRQDPDSLYNLGDEYPLLGEACVDVFYRRGRLFVTRNYGPLTLLENGKVLEFEDEEEIWIEGLIFFEWNERSIGMMGQLGLTIIEDGVPNGDSIRLHHHPMSEGSGKININSFRAHQGKVYIASLEGLYAVDTADLLNPHHLPKVVVQEMAINGRDTAILPHNELSHDQNTFRLRYAAISYGNYKIRAGFEYKMVGLDEDWQTYTNDFILQYTTLPPGEYELNIRARMGYYIWSEPCKVRFTIAPPFWATWWFLTLMGALLILLIWLLIRYRTRQALKAEKLRSEMALELSELEMRALKAQLNPHFIFNSIGSVHHYLRNNSPDEAARYLERFSRVMRQILEHSDSKEISLEEELELLQNYIRLESERLDHSPIQLEIDSKGMDLKEILLPPALFQPYIENAIWHGLRPKKSDRKLQLLLSKEAEALRIEIRDNGIGRQASKKSGNTQRAHRSFGMRIASGRLRHLNHSEESPIEILDLTDPEGEAIGTSVRLSIPYKRKVA
ncbi:MAG: histidine kinase [Salibacteraceae bacterium]